MSLLAHPFDQFATTALLLCLLSEKHQSKAAHGGGLKTHGRTEEHGPCGVYKSVNSHNIQNSPKTKEVAEMGHILGFPDVLMLGQNHPFSPCL